MGIRWYELVFRGVSPGCFPRSGWVATEHNHVNYKGRKYGAVAYNRDLTEKEIRSYELNPIDPVRDLYEFEGER